MIIYGTKTPHLKSVSIPGKCRSCGTDDSLYLNAYQKYVHVFWIPFFPIGKAYQTVCGHCKQVLLENEVKEYYRTSYQDLKDQLRTPIWTFTGLGLVALLVLYSSYASQQNDQENQAFIEAPKVGDVYEYKTGEGLYSVMKVVEISKDTVYVVQANYGVNKRTGLSKLKYENDSTFSDLAYPLHKNEVKSKFEKKEIIDVIRK